MSLPTEPADLPAPPFLASVPDEDVRSFLADAVDDLARRRDWVGLLVRRDLLASPWEEDSVLALQAVQDALELQDPLGYWDLPLAVVRTDARLTATGQHLRVLHELGLTRDEPYVRRAIQWVLQQPAAVNALLRQRRGKKPRLVSWGVGNAALWALASLNVDDPCVDVALATAEALYRRWVGKPDMHFAYMGPLAAAGRLASPAMEEAAGWMRENQASDGFWPGNPARPALETLLLLPHDTASPLFTRMLAAVSRDLARTNAWPDRLQTHGMAYGPLDTREYLRYLFLLCIARLAPPAPDTRC